MVSVAAALGFLTSTAQATSTGYYYNIGCNQDLTSCTPSSTQSGSPIDNSSPANAFGFPTDLTANILNPAQYDWYFVEQQGALEDQNIWYFDLSGPGYVVLGIDAELLVSVGSTNDSEFTPDSAWIANNSASPVGLVPGSGLPSFAPASFYGATNFTVLSKLDLMSAGRFAVVLNGTQGTYYKMFVAVGCNLSGGACESGSTDVPEPATLALFGFGLAGIGFARRHRRAA